MPSNKQIFKSAPYSILVFGPAWLFLILGCGPAAKQDASLVSQPQVQELEQPKQSVTESGTKPTTEPAAEPTAEPAAEPIVQSPLDSLPAGKRYRMGTVALDANDLATVRAIADELLQSKEVAVLGRALDAFLLIRGGKLDEALAVAEELSEISIMQAECYVIAGEVFMRRVQFLAAINAFSNAVKLDPSHVRAHRWLGVVYHDTGAMSMATDHLRSVAKFDPKDYRALRFSGLIFREYEKFEDSVTDYREALNRNPPEKIANDIRLEMAESLLKLRKLEEVQATLATVTARSATRSALLAEALETEGKNAEAMKAAEEAIELDGNHLRASLVLGRLYNGNRQWDLSVERLQKVVAKYPAEHEPMFLLGRALVSSGQDEEGKKMLAESKRIKDVFLRFSELNTEAVRRSQDVPLRIELGKLAEELRKPGIARTWYLAALGLDSENAIAKEALTRLSSPPKSQ